MVQASQRTDFSGPGLIRLLARLSEINPRESGQTFADRLSQWLGWADAIVPCGLPGVTMTSVAKEIGRASPTLAAEVRAVVVASMATAFGLRARPRPLADLLPPG